LISRSRPQFKLDSRLRRIIPLTHISSGFRVRSARWENFFIKVLLAKLPELLRSAHKR
jgi:hypothetical protein